MTSLKECRSLSHQNQKNSLLNYFFEKGARDVHYKNYRIIID